MNITLYFLFDFFYVAFALSSLMSNFFFLFSVRENSMLAVCGIVGYVI